MKNRVFIISFLAIIVLVLFAGCDLYNVHGNGHITSEERAVDKFDSIVLDGVGNINVHPSNDHKVVITTDSNIQDMIKISVNNEILCVTERNRWGFDATKLNIDVYLPEIKSVELNGVGNINILEGKTDNFNIYMCGVGDIDAQNYKAKDIYIKHSGVGDAKIWAVDSINGSLTGIGNILYKGDPHKDIRVKGIGTVKSF